jgi:hypothetical protein
MKKRMLMLFVSLFAVTPAILGSAWAGMSEHRSAKASIYSVSRECELREAKRIAAVKGKPSITTRTVDPRETKVVR